VQSDKWISVQSRGLHMYIGRRSQDSTQLELTHTTYTCTHTNTRLHTHTLIYTHTYTHTKRTLMHTQNTHIVLWSQGSTCLALTHTLFYTNTHIPNPSTYTQTLIYTHTHIHTHTKRTRAHSEHTNTHTHTILWSQGSTRLAVQIDGSESVAEVAALKQVRSQQPLARA